MKETLRKLGLLSLGILGMIFVGGMVIYVTQNVLPGLLSMFIYVYATAKWDKL